MKREDVKREEITCEFEFAGATMKNLETGLPRSCFDIRARHGGSST
jgi:hypothetical protein